MTLAASATLTYISICSTLNVLAFKRETTTIAMMPITLLIHLNICMMVIGKELVLNILFCAYVRVPVVSVFTSASAHYLIINKSKRSKCRCHIHGLLKKKIRGGGGNCDGDDGNNKNFCTIFGFVCLLVWNRSKKNCLPKKRKERIFRAITFHHKMYTFICATILFTLYA